MKKSPTATSMAPAATTTEVVRLTERMLGGKFSIDYCRTLNVEVRPFANTLKINNQQSEIINQGF